MTDPISEPVRRLISQHISSAAELEMLSLLVKDQRVWSVGEISELLRLPPDYVKRLLHSLVNEGLVCSSAEGYRVVPGRESVVEDLVESFHRYQARVTSLIYAQPKAVRDFADAFRLRSAVAEGEAD